MKSTIVTICLIILVVIFTRGLSQPKEEGKTFLVTMGLSLIVALTYCHINLLIQCINFFPFGEYVRELMKLPLFITAYIITTTPFIYLVSKKSMHVFSIKESMHCGIIGIFNIDLYAAIIFAIIVYFIGLQLRCLPSFTIPGIFCFMFLCGISNGIKKEEVKYFQ